VGGGGATHREGVGQQAQAAQCGPAAPPPTPRRPGPAPAAHLARQTSRAAPRPRPPGCRTRSQTAAGGRPGTPPRWCTWRSGRCGSAASRAALGAARRGVGRRASGVGRGSAARRRRSGPCPPSATSVAGARTAPSCRGRSRRRSPRSRWRRGWSCGWAPAGCGTRPCLRTRRPWSHSVSPGACAPPLQGPCTQAPDTPPSTRYPPTAVDGSMGVKMKWLRGWGG
jgi:hypothetical protein